jgi:site-specific recombinase XerD
MSTVAVSALRQRMIEDMTARQLGAHSQRSHIYSCKRLAAFLQRSPDTATVEDIRRFQLYLAETGTSICSRNRIMTGLRFLFRVTLRRLDLAAEIHHLREPQKIPQVISPDEARRLLAVADGLRTRLLLRYVAAGSSPTVAAGAAASAPFTAVSAAAAPNRPAIFLSILHPPELHTGARLRTCV